MSKSRPVSSIGRPPQSDWPELELSDIAEFQIGFPRVNFIGSDISEKRCRLQFIGISRRHLELVVEMLEELGPSSWETLKLTLSDNMGLVGGHYPRVYLKWFCDLLKKMVETRPALVRADVALWPEDDTYFFCGLRLRVWSFDTLFTGDEITVGLLSFSHKAFWDDFHRRAFLHLLRKRWQEIPNEGRSLWRNE